MIFNKPKFWDKKNNLLSFIFLPLTLFVFIITVSRKIIIKAKKFNIPIICVGNIYVGGTGKTPTSIFLGNELKKLGHDPVILRKYYKNHADEHEMIKKNFHSLSLCKNRVDGIKESQKRKFDSVILDDGFQDHSIEKDLSIVCFNQNQLIGNGMIMPSGPLRESLSGLKRADIILINGKKDTVFENKILEINRNLEIFYSNYIPTNLEEFRNKKLLAIAGIGNPENFFELIEANNLKIERKIVFADHHIFTKSEIKKIVDYATNKNYQIIMTEKDYFKIKHFDLKDIKFLKIHYKISDQEKFLNRISKIYD